MLLVLIGLVAYCQAGRVKPFINQPQFGVGGPCGKYTTQSPCDADNNCAWCMAGAIPSECVTVAQAKTLPVGVFKCDKLTPVKAARPCGQYTAKGTCDANSTCTWCTAGAIPSECVTITQAKTLPPGVFNCDKTVVEEIAAPEAPPKRRKKYTEPLLLQTRPCGQYTAETACNANSTCVWCKAAAIPSECVTTAQAKTLPPAVFVCDKKSEGDWGTGLEQLMNLHNQPLDHFKLLLAISQLPQPKWEQTMTEFSADDGEEYVRVKRWVGKLKDDRSFDEVVTQTRVVFKQISRMVDMCPAGTKTCAYAAGKTECCTKGENCIPGVGCRCFNHMKPAANVVLYFQR